METLKNETEALEPVLIHENTQQIERYKSSVTRTLPLIQAVVDAYRVLPAGVPELTNDNFHAMFMDRDAYFNNANDAYYQATFAEMHRGMGLTSASGKLLVADQMPNYSAVVKALSEYFTALTDHYSYSGNEFFLIDAEGNLQVNDQHLSRAIEGEKLYLVTEQEHAIQAAFEQFAESITKLEALIPDNVFTIKSDPGSPVAADFAKLNNFIDSAIDRFDAEADPTYKIKVDFYRKLKAYNARYNSEQN